MAPSQAGAPGAESGGSVQGWGVATVLAIAMLAVAFALFTLVPIWILDHYQTRLTTTGRDLILIAGWVVAFVLCAWLFVRLQRVRRSR